MTLNGHSGFKLIGNLQTHTLLEARRRYSRQENEQEASSSR